MSHPGTRTPAPETEDTEDHRDDSDNGPNYPEDIDGLDHDDEPESPDEAEEDAEDEEPNPERDGGPGPDAAEEPAFQPKKQNKAEQRFQRLANERKAERERADRLERELSEIRAAQQGRQTEEAKRAEEAKLQYMSPEEKFEYLRQKDREDFNRQIGMLQFQQQDASDRVAFEGLCARKPHLADIADEVERELANARRAGVNLPRQHIAYAILGKRADERAASVKTRQSKKAAERVSRETAKPGNARSDAGGGGRRLSEAEARAKRLEGQTF